jgi:hypothetical protein
MATKPTASREEVYAFAEAAMAAGRLEAAGAAVICFEVLQGPENVVAGYVRWSDYRSQAAPDAIRIEHHKTGANVLHRSSIPRMAVRRGGTRQCPEARHSPHP